MYIKATQKKATTNSGSHQETALKPARPFNTPQHERATHSRHNFGRVAERRDESASLRMKRNKTGLPDRLKAGIERLSGVSLNDVRVHRDSAAPARLQALAYTRGTDIHLSPGQEQHLSHEAWHVVQQKQGRVKPTMQFKGMGVNDNDALEHEADVMGTRASSGTSVVAGGTVNRVVPATTGSEVKTDGSPPIQAKGKSKSWKRRRAARLAAEEQERQIKREAATKIQSAYRGRLGRRRAELTRSMMDVANRKKGGNFDIQTTFKPGEDRPELANRTLYRRHGEDVPVDPKDKRRYTSYVQYDQRGGPLRRVDITGATHDRVPTPHVLEYTQKTHQTPKGALHQYGTPPKNRVRPAHYWEVPPFLPKPEKKPKQDDDDD